MARKKKGDSKRLEVTIPEDMYFVIKQMAKEELRSISNQARLLLEVGISVVQQSQEMSDAVGEECGASDGECTPMIGFKIDSSGDEIGDEDDGEDEENPDDEDEEQYGQDITCKNCRIKKPGKA